MQTLSAPTTRPPTPQLRAAADATVIVVATATPCANQAACAASDRSTPSAYLPPCPMTCVGVKFQDMRWD
jgi:hypothetical protein